jgi:hypothetical protein
MGIGNLALRDGAVSVTGFSSTTLRAAGTLVSGGTGTLAVGGDLALAAPRIALARSEPARIDVQEIR